MTEIIIPGQAQMVMSVAALKKIAEYILEHHKQMKKGDHFTITGTDGKKLKINLVD